MKEKSSGSFINGIKLVPFENENKVGASKTFKILVKYFYREKNREYLSNEVYTWDELKFIKRLKRIPLTISKDGSVCINSEKISQMEKDFECGKDVEFESLESGSDNKIITIESINRRIKFTNIIKFVVGCFSLFMLFMFCIGISTVLEQKIDILIIVFGSFFLIFLVFMVYFFVVKTIIDCIAYKNALANGVCTVASKYNIVMSYNESRRYYDLKFFYTDEYGVDRIKKRADLFVEPFFFTKWSVDKLPIKVWKRFAIVDYERLLECQKLNRVDE